MSRNQKWKKVKLKYLADLRSGETITSDSIEPVGKYPVYGGGALRGYTSSYTHNGHYVLIGRQGAHCGNVKTVKGKLWASEHAIVVTPITTTDIEWLGYLLENMNLNQYSMSAAQPGLAVSMIKNLEVLCPPKEVQKKITNYLSSKISLIEDLVLKKERLILLFEEKRQAIITEAVTNGLNPNVKMKDSGVEWIGEIPEHWYMKKVGYLGRLQNGISKSSEEFGFGTPFISYGDVYKNMVLPSEASGLVNSSTEDQQLYSVEKGDIFFTRTSETIEEIGFASTCLETIPNATFAGFLIRFRPNTLKITPNYAKYYFRSDLRRHYFVKEMNLVTRASLGQGLLRNFPVVLPNINEQESIASYLDKQTKAIDSSVSLIKEQIQKLKEYRQSLIYEAITGKIDVRDFKAEQVMG